MQRLRVLGTAACLCLLGLAFAPRSARAEDSPTATIYKWVDENGIAHYTTNKDRIPRNLRNRIRSLDEVKREQEEQEAAAAAEAARAPVAATTAAPTATPIAAPTTTAQGSAGVAEEKVGGGAFQEGPLGATASATATAPPEPTVSPVAPPVEAPEPPPPALPPGGPPVGSDIYAVHDAGDDQGSIAPAQVPAKSAPALLAAKPSEGSNAEPNAAARREELDHRIADLEANLAKDEERLKELISTARMDKGKPAPLYGVPELEELARRFPKLQEEIATLRAERRALDAPR